MPTSPRRRWFQFGIGTMLVLVTVFALWLGCELKFIRDRKAVIADAAREGSAVPSDDSSGIPFWRRLLGDRAMDLLFLPYYYSDADLDNARRLFPEITDPVYLCNILYEYGEAREPPAPAAP